MSLESSFPCPSPKIQIFIDGGEDPYDEYLIRDAQCELFNAINKSYKVGPVMKVYMDKVFGSGYDDKYTLKGNIYDLWKNGYTPKDPDNFLDVAFSWRKKIPKTR